MNIPETWTVNADNFAELALTYYGEVPSGTNWEWGHLLGSESLVTAVVDIVNYYPAVIECGDDGWSLCIDRVNYEPGDDTDFILSLHHASWPAGLFVSAPFESDDITDDNGVSLFNAEPIKVAEWVATEAANLARKLRHVLAALA